MPDTVVKMPQLGESVAEGTIGRWLKQPGDRVERDEPLVEIQTDKVNADVPSPVAGILQKILLPEGTTAAVKSDMAIIATGGADEPSGTVDPSSTASEPSSATEPPSASSVSSSPAGTSGSDAAVRPPAGSPPSPRSFSYDQSPGGGVVGHREEEAPAPSSNGEKRFYTPVVLRMAQEHDIDLSQIEGSGAHGRVTRKDVERAIASGGAASDTTQPTPETAQPTPVEPSRSAATQEPASSAPAAVPGALTPETPASDEQRALTPMRRAIADHMSRARRDIPDAWSLTEIDVTRLVRYRESLQADWQARHGFELTYLPFFIKAVLAGLRAVPELNATFADNQITLHRQYHLGIAVSVPGGLVVPVLRDADTLSVAGVALALREVVQKARNAKLSPADLQGATFTVNNPGALGSIMSQPIVPVGQAGIITMEAIVKRPVVVADDAIAVRSMMNSCISFDHRVLDGSGALTFLRTLREQLETVDYPLY